MSWADLPRGRAITVITTKGKEGPKAGEEIEAITTIHLDGSVVTRLSSLDVVMRHFENVEARLKWLSAVQRWEEQAHYWATLALPGVAGAGWLSQAVLHALVAQIAVTLIGGGIGLALPWAVRAFLRWRIQQFLNDMTARLAE